MALVDPRATFFAEETQRINNRLPQFHAGRRLRTSNWAKVTNDLWGITVEDYSEQEERGFRNRFLPTARMDEPDLLRVANLPQGTDMEPPANNINALRNGSFEARSRIDKVGDYWDHVGTVGVEATALFGATAPTLSPIASETARITQTITTDPWGTGDSRSFSAWYRIATWAGGTIPSASHGLIVSVTFSDSTTTTFRAPFAQDTGDKWRRVTLTVTPTKTVDSYIVQLETARSAGFDIDVPIRIDAVQAQQGSVATSWKSNLNDRPNWFDDDYFTPINFDAPVPVFITNDLREFYHEAVPTRINRLTNRNVATSSNRGGGVGTATDFHRRDWVFQWDIDTALNKIRKIGVDPLDVYASFDISLFTGTASGPQFEEGVSGLTYRCVAQFARWLYVVHEIPDLNGSTVMALSVVDPRVPYPSPSYYEAKMTIELPIPVQDYHACFFRVEDPQHIYIQTPDTEYTIRLFHDYAMLDPNRLQALFREKYSSLALTD